MLSLPNGCWCSGTKGNAEKNIPDQLAVTPANWQNKNALLKKTWCIHYRFHDPACKEQYPNGKQVQVKTGNNLKTREERQKAVRHIMENELYQLQFRGYNPITQEFKMEERLLYEVHPDTPLVDALAVAVKKLNGVKGTIEDAESCLRYIKIALVHLRYSLRPVSSIRGPHLQALLDYMQDKNIGPEPKGKKKGAETVKAKKHPFTDAKYNRYRSNLVMIFKKLKKLGAVDSNYAEDIERKKKVKKIRVTLLDKERVKVDKYLSGLHPAFHRFMLIFFHAGVRETEIMAVRGTEVDLERQVFKVMIKKGREYREAEKIIVDNAVPLWREAMHNCGPDDYVFAEGFVPAPVPIHANVVSRWWLRHVKKPLGIKADFYALKHLHSTELTEQMGEAAAAAINSHESTAMVEEVYDVRQRKRKDDRLKRNNVKFA